VWWISTGPAVSFLSAFCSLCRLHRIIFSGRLVLLAASTPTVHYNRRCLQLGDADKETCNAVCIKLFILPWFQVHSLNWNPRGMYVVHICHFVRASEEVCTPGYWFLRQTLHQMNQVSNSYWAKAFFIPCYQLLEVRLCSGTLSEYHNHLGNLLTCCSFSGVNQLFFF